MSNPVILIENKSSVVSAADLDYAIGACQKQITEDFEPVWGWGADLAHSVNKFQMQVIIVDLSDEPGDLGYHFKEGKPVTYVFAKTSIADSGEWVSTLSHELLEMIADPGANLAAYGHLRYVSGEFSSLKGWVFFEVCDPVEAQNYSIDGLKVSNFVTPEWFESQHKKNAVPFDHMGKLHYPFQIAPSGYVDVNVNGRSHTLWGKEADQQRRRMRLRKSTGWKLNIREGDVE